MSAGKVKMFNVEKGYGFISPADGSADLFVHSSQIGGEGFRFLLPGEPVEYECSTDRSGRKVATHVHPPADRRAGVVIQFDHSKGWGFIRDSQTDERYFLHFTDILTASYGRTTAEEGEEVTFSAAVREKDGKLYARMVKRADSRPPLLRFAAMGDEDDWTARLAAKAEAENWGRTSGGRTQRPILRSYVMHTFARLEQEDASKVGKKIAIGRAGTVPYASFNTGLVTPNQEEIFALFSGKDRDSDGRAWKLAGFHAESDHEMLGKFDSLPELANFFDDPSVLLYDRTCELYLDVDHIVDDNIRRFPIELQNNKFLARQSLTAAREQTRKRVYRNYRTAVPQYHRGSVQLLLPICLVDPAKADLALVVTKHDKQYRGETVLTLDMAYNNARLLCRPDSDWLTP